MSQERRSCTETVFSGARWDFAGHRCGNVANSDPDESGVPTKCKTHSAERKAERDQKLMEKHRHESERRSREIAQGEAKTDAINAIKAWRDAVDLQHKDEDVDGEAMETAERKMLDAIEKYESSGGTFR